MELDNTNPFVKFTVAWLERIQANPDERRGQAAFNALLTYAPTWAEKVRASDIDPFHREENVIPFLSYLHEKWK